MSTYSTRLIRSAEVAQGTRAFYLEKPAGFEFRPGQAMEVILPGAAAGDDGHHAFSIVSAPHEAELVFATRMRDSTYKRHLASLPPGTALEIDGPFGNLTLHKKTERAAVFVAGGIGITPFMSILRHAALQPTGQRLALLYSNRRPEDTAFLAELQALAKNLPGFALHATMTDMAQSSQPWAGAQGMIDSAFVQRCTAALPAPIFYISGPPAMVQALRQVLVAAGADEDDVRSEEFYGY